VDYVSKSHAGDGPGTAKTRINNGSIEDQPLHCRHGAENDFFQKMTFLKLWPKILFGLPSNRPKANVWQVIDRDSLSLRVA